MKRRTNRAMRFAARGASALFFASMVATTHAMGCSDSEVDCNEVAELRASIDDDNREAILEQIKEIDGSYQCGYAPPEQCVPKKTSVPLNDTCGVFVSPAGKLGAEGTMSAPFASFQEAIERAQDGGTGTIYACAGEFNEAVIVNGSITVFGGLDCDDGWKWGNGSRKTVLTASPGQVPLTMRPGNGTVSIEDLKVLAASGDSTVDGQSSIAAVADGGKVKLARCELEAQDAADGFAGAALRPSPRDENAPVGTPGNNGKGACSMPGTVVTTELPVPNGCKTPELGDDSIGGLAGIGQSSQEIPGESGDPTRTLEPNGVTHPNGGFRIDGSCPPDNDHAADGQDGHPGKDGANAGHTNEDGAEEVARGSISQTGYTGMQGNSGTNGTTAQGGGGGAGAKGGSACTSAGFTGTGGASGGNGGSGGCGGQGGNGGHFGGSSIALISLDATLDFEDVVLKAGNGGNGGDGEPGQLGGQGGDGGAGGLNVGALSPGCKGGRGGKGGDGGHGGGGLGGHSVGIAFVGKQPPNTGVAVTHGQPGQGGTGPDDTRAAGGKAAEALSFNAPNSP